MRFDSKVPWRKYRSLRIAVVSSSDWCHLELDVLKAYVSNIVELSITLFRRSLAPEDFLENHVTKCVRITFNSDRDVNLGSYERV